jgi:hypothetical protein
MTAKAWGLTPSQFEVLQEKDKVQMLAYETAVSIMNRWERKFFRPKDRNVINLE